QKEVLQKQRPRPLNPQVRVPPIGFFGCFDPVVVAVADVDAAHKSGMPVYNNDFAVVAIIDPVGQLGKNYSVKGINLYPRGSKRGDQSFPDRTAAKIIVYHAHINPLPCLFGQYLPDSPAGFVIFDDVVFYMDMLFCCPDGPQHFREFLFAVDQQFYLVAPGQGTSDVPEKHPGQPLAALKLRAALFEDASGIFADFPQKFLPQLLILKQLLAVHFSVAVIDPKEKVEEYAKDRDEYHKQQVGEGFYVAVCIVDNAQA